MASEATFEILKSIDSEKLYRETSQTGKEIKHKFQYRSSQGKLDGYKAEQVIQTFDVEISKSKVIAMGGQDDIKLIETLLATLMERYDTFGPFHQYNKPFILGPSQFDQKKGTLLTKTNAGTIGKPSVRDVDQLLWIKYLEKKEKYVLVSMQFFHNDRLPGVVKTEWVSFEISKIDTDPEKIETDVQSIFDNLFIDGKDYSIQEVPGELLNKRQSFSQIKNANEKSSLLLLWIAQNLLSTRYLIDFKQMEKSDLAQNLSNMLASALIGHMGFVTPANENQYKLPVPVGKITIDKLIEVRNAIVLEPSKSPTTIASSLKDLYADTDSEEEYIKEDNFNSKRNVSSNNSSISSFEIIVSDEEQEEYGDIFDWE